MPFVFPTWTIVTCILCMDFVMAILVLLLSSTKGIFSTERFCLGAYFLVFTGQCVRLVVFQVLLFSLKGRWYQRLIHERTNWRWFREVHDCPLVELPFALACRVCRSGEVCMRKIYILVIIIWHIWNQATLLSMWICATG